MIGMTSIDEAAVLDGIEQACQELRGADQSGAARIYIVSLSLVVQSLSAFTTPFHTGILGSQILLPPSETGPL